MVLAAKSERLLSVQSADLRIANDSPARALGLQTGDVIVSIDQKPATTPPEAAAQLKEAAAQGNVLLLVNRHGTTSDCRSTIMGLRGAAIVDAALITGASPGRSPQFFTLSLHSLGVSPNRPFLDPDGGVHPVSCGNWQQWVMGWTPPDGIYVPR